MNNCDTIKSCRLCKSEHLNTVISFGPTALANSYPIKKMDKEELFDLTVLKCSNCGHVQLKETVSPEKLFSNYLYASSDSPALVNHFKEFAQSIKDNFIDNDHCKILEIGCNDGVLLKEFETITKSKLIGVEPAKNIAAVAKKRLKAEIISDFFNEETSENIKNKFGSMNIICANNVFAHVADIDSLIKGIYNCLDRDGIFIFENAYLLDTIKGLYFDQVYHEHLQYYGIIPLRKYLKSYKMDIFNIEKSNIQGGSFRIFVKKEDSTKHAITSKVQEFISNELDYKLYSDATFENFVSKLEDLKLNLKDLINKIIKENKTISCYGCPAKFALFSKFFDLDDNIIKYVVDDSPLKQNRFSPGKKIQIVSRKYFYDNPTDYCIISVWNMAEAIVKNNKDYQGKFIIPMPELKII